MTQTTKPLRPWQNDHLRKAQAKFETSTALCTVFLSQAVTGGGKTTLGVAIAKYLLDAGAIQVVKVLCPSVEIARGWVEKLAAAGFAASLENPDAEGLNAFAVCYHSAKTHKGSRVTLLILDEIHHAERDESWGTWASAIAKECKYVVALTGTPWMTKGRIAILDAQGYYKVIDGVEQVVPDAAYTYGQDLLARGNDRATVPLHCTFFESVTTGTKKIDGKDVPVTLRLQAVTKENRADICDPKKTDHTIALGPHVTINDNLLTNNTMARDMLSAAIVKRRNLEETPAFVKAKAHRIFPIGLVSCRNIKEARRVAEYIEVVHEETVEVIVSDDTASADRLREISTGKTADGSLAPKPPRWIVSVGMVSEGVDIPAIKVIVILNQITTLLFLIQLIGRALRRVPMTFVKNKNGEDVLVYADGGYDPEADKVVDFFNGTMAYIFAPAHPVVVRVGTELEKISNMAVKERKDSGEPTEPAKPRDEKVWTTATGGATDWYRGQEVPFEMANALAAIELDLTALSELGPHWIDMTLDWVRRGKVVEAMDEVNRRLKELGVVVEERASFKEKLDYDVETKLLKKEAARLVAQIRFTTAFSREPDEIAFPAIRKLITNRAVGRWVDFSKLSLEKKHVWVNEAKKMLREVA